LIYERLLEVVEEKGAGYFTLLDPDRLTSSEAISTAIACAEAGIDAFLVGTSFLVTDRLNSLIREIKSNTRLPVILFPGSVSHLTPEADALLFLSLISGRNPAYLIEEHVKASPLIKIYGIEPIPTGYLLVESGKETSVLYMSNTRPIPRDKPDIAKAHALAAQYLGMKLVYLEAGSGARLPVPTEMVREVCEYVDIPVVVGGGIRTPEAARERVEAGAKFIVTGTIVEEKGSSILYEFAEAVHRS